MTPMGKQERSDHMPTDSTTAAQGHATRKKRFGGALGVAMRLGMVLLISAAMIGAGGPFTLISSPLFLFLLDIESFSGLKAFALFIVPIFLLLLFICILFDLVSGDFLPRWHRDTGRKINLLFVRLGWVLLLLLDLVVGIVAYLSWRMWQWRRMRAQRLAEAAAWTPAGKEDAA